jgi:rhodanese-related sulfurtransferase
VSAQPIFERAAARAEELQLGYAGAVTCDEAHQLQSSGAAIIVDVRTRDEYDHVGHVEGTKLVPWRRDGEHQPDPLFAERLREIYEPDATLLLICRSGVRSHYAAQVATDAGFARVYNVLDGFEQGWRPAGLPWVR